jgi:SNF family Na+-dependent transporter
MQTVQTWRFVWLLGQQPPAGGGLVFLLVWVLGLALWAVPVATLEAALGRNTSCQPIDCVGKV